MGIVMNMSSYETERDESMESEYGEEIMRAGWNPAVALACQQSVSAEQQLKMPPDLATVDVELFLKKIYACQR